MDIEEIFRKVVREEYKDIVRDVAYANRQDIRQKICSRSDIYLILSTNNKGLVDMMKDPACLIRPAKRKGKYDLDSVYRESNRLVGIKESSRSLRAQNSVN